MNQTALFGIPPSPCSVAQALSALVKHTRLRRYEDAVYWMNHLYVHFPKDSFRTTKRLLILSAEDCLNATVQNTAMGWYSRVAREKNLHSVSMGAAALLSLICGTRNWWSFPEGQTYILLWRRAEKLAAAYDGPVLDLDRYCEKTQEVLSMEERDVDDVTQVLAWHMVYRKEKTYNGLEYANRLIEMAGGRDFSARQVALVHRRCVAALSGDDNYLGQSLYRLLGMRLDEEAATVMDDATIAAIHHRTMEEALSKPRTPEAWTQDGIHCKGNDRRFAGMLSSMVGCCNSYLAHGRLHPDDAWDDTTYRTETLEKNLAYLP